jgi:hypothetical protein
MTDFQTLHELWQQQRPVQQGEPSVVIQKAMAEQKQFNFRLRSTIGIFLVTLGILIWYFMFYLHLVTTTIQLSAALMIGSILCRVGVEMISHWQLRQIDFTQTLKKYAHQFTRFYVFRNLVNFFFTPLTMLLYSFGFIHLLPSFKANMSEGWYLYTLISGVGFLVGFSVFLCWHVRREMHILQEMKVVDERIRES